MEEKKENTKTEKTAKITVTAEAETALDEMVQRVNDGFSGGRLSRQDLATWLVLYFQKNDFDGCIEIIRADHFDQVAHLEAVLKQARQARRDGASVTEISSILSGTLAVVPKEPRRRPKKMECSTETAG